MGSGLASPTQPNSSTIPMLAQLYELSATRVLFHVYVVIIVYR
jgi:hypothetical protein